MPKTPFQRKEVKFASIDAAPDAGLEREEWKDGRLSAPSEKKPCAELGSASTQSQQTEIEIITEDETPHSHAASEPCSGCHMLSHSHKHQRLTSDDVSDDSDDDNDACRYSPQQGPHIVLLTIICIPFVFLIGVVVSGYLGILTWYNIFLYYYEEKGWIHRIFICPFLIILFPPVILTIAFGISIYSSIKQLSWYLLSWQMAVSDFEKGFYAWLCQQLGLQHCSPYEVITLDDDDEDNFGRATTSHIASAV